VACRFLSVVHAIQTTLRSTDYQHPKAVKDLRKKNLTLRISDASHPTAMQKYGNRGMPFVDPVVFSGRFHT
jgi:hypothetical protein